MTKEKITALTCKKHVKIYKLKQLGFSNKEIAETLGTNAGHVYNALKNYETKPEMKTAADLL
jgi:DNA-binding CsgD family transcriptional regulator